MGQDANELKRGLFHSLSEEEGCGGGKRGGVMEIPAIGLEKCSLHTRIDEEGEEGTARRREGEVIGTSSTRITWTIS